MTNETGGFFPEKFALTDSIADGTAAAGRAQSTGKSGAMFRNPPRLSYDDLITGEKFVGICDAVWFHYEPTPFDPHSTSRFFYSDTYRIEELFERLPPPSDRQVVVVTHNADRGVTAELRHAPVHHQHFTERTDHDVFRFEIAMDDAMRVGERDRVTNARKQP